MYIKYEDGVWFVACAGIRVSPECSTVVGAQAWLDKFLDFKRTGVS